MNNNHYFERFYLNLFHLKGEDPKICENVGTERLLLVLLVYRFP